MGEKTGEGQSGGVNIAGAVGSVGGDIVGRDKIVGVPSAAALDGARIGVTATADSTFEWREEGAQVTRHHQRRPRPDPSPTLTL